MEWKFGITDRCLKTWRRREPRWEDEQLTATSENSYHDVMKKLCETALAKRREHRDYNINSHLWSLEIASERGFLQPPIDPIARLMDKMSGGESSSDDDDDDDEENYRGITKVMPKEDIKRERELLDLGDYNYVESTTKLCRKYCHKATSSR